MRFKFLLIFAYSAFLTFGQEDEIRKMMQEQIDCWNKGDLECFMNTYLRSDELVFVGRDGPKYGWEVTLNNYKKNYPNQDEMGQLSFNLLKFISLGKNHQLVIGRWSLNRKSDSPSGHFSVVFRKIDGEWKIIADHSS